MAPEVLGGHATFASPAQDIWSIGIMTFAMIFHKFPFRS
jgi:serine/threonine protein kinase